MDALLNRMRAEAERAVRRRTPQVHGRVTSYDPARHAAKVVYLPDGDFPEQSGDQLVSGWIPVSTHWIGNGWGMFSPPSPGDQVIIDFSEGDQGSGIIKGRVFDLKNVPLSVNSGEFWLVHQSGAFAKLTNDGKVSFQDKHGSTIVANADGTIAITATTLIVNGDLHVTGKVYGGYGGADQVGLLTHDHTLVQPGGGNSGPPAAGT